MTAGDCIRSKGAAGDVDPDRAGRLADLFDEQLAELSHMNAAQPEASAAVRTLAAAKHRTRVKKRALLQTMKAQAEIRGRIEGAEDPLEAALAILDFDPTRRQSGLNVEMVKNAIRGQAHARLVSFLDRFGSKAAGLDVALPNVRADRRHGLRELVREIFGEETGSAEAKASAEGVGEAFEFLRQTFNAVGGSIPKRKGWGLPQTHSRVAMNATTKDEWADFIIGLSRREDMIDFDTGLPLTDTRLRRLAGEIYDDVVTDGLRDGARAAGANIASRRAQSRFWVFRDADAWLAYHDRFGEGDAFQTVLGHINAMSRDIALMKVLGPSPNGSAALMERLVGQERGAAALGQSGKAGARAAARLAKGEPSIRNLYGAVTGAIHDPAPGRLTIANISAANRNVLTSAMLGGAFFSALADRTFTRITANLNGVPAAKTLARQLKLLNPASKDDRELAGRLAFVNEIALGSAIGQARYMGEVVGPEWSRKIADVVLRLSFLSPWTNWGSTAFGMEFLGHVTSLAGRSLGDFPDATRRAFEAYGISPAEWDLMRRTPLWTDAKTGASFLRPQDIIGDPTDAGGVFDRRMDAALKLQSMILTETELAVPKKTARVSAILSGGQRPGMFLREVMDNVALFKAFPITLIMTHLRRAAMGQMQGAERSKYIAHLIIGTAILGTLGEQLSQISKGRDPLPLDPSTEEGRSAWLKGLTRGGGLGLFGDFLFSDVNRFGGGITETLAGPIFGTEIPALTRLTAGNVQELVKEGAAKNAGRELVRFTRLMMPGRSLWYTTLAMERLVFDEAQKMVDPHHGRSFREMERRAQREFNQSYFSPPGSGFPPARAPRLDRALGDSR